MCANILAMCAITLQLFSVYNCVFLDVPHKISLTYTKHLWHRDVPGLKISVLFFHACGVNFH
jgi:hypothetical protein